MVEGHRRAGSPLYVRRAPKLGIRDFHEAILGERAWPLPVLEANLTAVFPGGDRAQASRWSMQALTDAMAAGRSVRRRAGLIDETHVLGEIGEVMNGTKPGRLQESDVTISKSLGSVVQDIACPLHLHERAVAENFGSRVPF